MISSGETILFTSGLFFELPLQEHTYSFFIRILFITNCKLHSEFDEDNLRNVSFTKKTWSSLRFPIFIAISSS